MTRLKPETEKIGNIAPFGLRMMPDLKASVEASAAANGRSMNAEIIARLEASGETLRDRFAMAALAGLDLDDTDGETAAHWAYDIADAMLIRRAKAGAA